MFKNLLIWFVAIAICVFSGVVTLGAAAKKKQPQIALLLQPTNGFAEETMAAMRMKAAVAKGDGQFPQEIDTASYALAIQAFKREPATPNAVAMIALAEVDGARSELMHKAFQLSRREQMIIGWMIADSGAQNDISATLTFYDTLMRTNSSAPKAVVPVLVNALSNPDFVEPFSKILMRDPPWASIFWEHILVVPLAMENGAQVRENLYKMNIHTNTYRDEALIEALSRNQYFESGQALFLTLSEDSQNSNLLQNGYFQKKSAFPPYDWQIISSGEYGAAISGGSLEISAIANSGGLFARQLVKLPKGNLRLKINAKSSMPTGASIEIKLLCAETAANTQNVAIIQMTDQDLTTTINNKHADCSYFWFDLIARAPETGTGFDNIIHSVTLELENDA